MKKNTLMNIVALVNGQPVDNMDELRKEVNEEWNRLNAKQEKNRNAYEAARELAFELLSDTPMTVKAIFAAGEDRWPEGFTAAKLQYAFLRYWADGIEKHDNGRSAYTYTRK